MKRCATCNGHIGHGNALLACWCPPGLCCPCDDPAPPAGPREEPKAPPPKGNDPR